MLSISANLSDVPAVWPTFVTAGVSLAALIGAVTISVMTIRESRRASRLDARRAIALEVVGWLHSAEREVETYARVASGPTEERRLFEDRIVEGAHKHSGEGRAVAARWGFVGGSTGPAITALVEAIDAFDFFVGEPRSPAFLVRSSEAPRTRARWARARNAALNELSVACAMDVPILLPAEDEGCEIGE